MLKISPSPARRKGSRPGQHCGFRRELLPPAKIFYEQQFQQLSRPSRGWARTACVFHQGHNATALSVNLEDGRFFCFACGQKGSSIIDFVMARDGVDFKRAAQLLGAWAAVEDSGQRRFEAAERQRQRELCDAAAEELATRERDLRFVYRGHIHLLESLGRKAAGWLDSGDLTVQQAEDAWGLLADLLPELREALAGYALLSFGSTSEKLEFLLHPDLRGAACASMLMRGLVRDDDGRILEVAL